MTAKKANYDGDTRTSPGKAKSINQKRQAGYSGIDVFRKETNIPSFFGVGA
jgi:hypothetical protein